MTPSKPWARHVAAEQQRRQGQAEQQAAFLRRATAWFRWMRLTTLAVSVLHWAVLSLAFKVVWWHPVVAVVMAGGAIMILPRLPYPILSGGLLGGGYGFVMALLMFGGVTNILTGLPQVILLVCVGFAAPVVVGMLLGYLVSQWDEDHLTQ